MARRSSDDWVRIVIDSLKVPPRLSDSGLINTVPKVLLNEKTMHFYLPQVISLGPYHFKKSHPLEEEIELLKSEVVNKLRRESCDDDIWNSIVNWTMEEETQSKIKQSYSRDINYGGEILCWIIMRDACLVLEVLHRLSGGEDREKQLWMDTILNRKANHPLLNEILKDMLKIENQLPFWVLNEFRFKVYISKEIKSKYDLDFRIHRGVEKALRRLSPLDVGERSHKLYEKNTTNHLLQLLHHCLMDRASDTDSDVCCPDLCTGNVKCPWPLICLFECLLLVYCISKCLYFILRVPIFLIWLIWNGWPTIISSDQAKAPAEEEEEGESLSLPSAEELTDIGVMIKKSGHGISQIKFEEEDRILWLPLIRIDCKCEVIFRNMMVMELAFQMDERPVTRFAVMMKELIKTREDVEILKKNNVIINELGRDEEVAELWNSMTRCCNMEAPKYESVENATKSVNCYRGKRWKVLWARFEQIKSWVVLSILGANLVLIMTFIQVVCLFHECSSK